MHTPTPSSTPNSQSQPTADPAMSDSHQPLSLSSGGGVADEAGVGASRATGPRTPEGKAVSSRNATTHGLFCRQAVLPHLGEDPQAYRLLLQTLDEQLRPRNLMERQYLELWAEASWKLRRLSRFEAQVWEDDTLTRAERLTDLEKLNRLQTSLRRQLDKAVHMLGPDVPALFERRTREDVEEKLGLTVSDLAYVSGSRDRLERAVRDNSRFPNSPEDFDQALGLERFDNADHAEAPEDKDCDQGVGNREEDENKNCENEPPSVRPLSPSITQRVRHPSLLPAVEALRAGAVSEANEEGEGGVAARRNGGEAFDYIAYRKREQALYNKYHPDKPDTLDWDDPETREAYGG